MSKLGKWNALFFKMSPRYPNVINYLQELCRYSNTTHESHIEGMNVWSTRHHLSALNKSFHKLWIRKEKNNFVKCSKMSRIDEETHYILSVVITIISTLTSGFIIIQILRYEKNLHFLDLQIWLICILMWYYTSLRIHTIIIILSLCNYTTNRYFIL